jgi:hypothetical protein
MGISNVEAQEVVGAGVHPCKSEQAPAAKEQHQNATNQRKVAA